MAGSEYAVFTLPPSDLTKLRQNDEKEDAVEFEVVPSFSLEVNVALLIGYLQAHHARQQEQVTLTESDLANFPSVIGIKFRMKHMTIRLHTASLEEKEERALAAIGKVKFDLNVSQADIDHFNDEKEVNFLQILAQRHPKRVQQIDVVTVQQRRNPTLPYVASPNLSYVISAQQSLPIVPLIDMSGFCSQLFHCAIELQTKAREDIAQTDVSVDETLERMHSCYNNNDNKLIRALQSARHAMIVDKKMNGVNCHAWAYYDLSYHRLHLFMFHFVDKHVVEKWKQKWCRLAVGSDVANTKKMTNLTEGDLLRDVRRQLNNYNEKFVMSFSSNLQKYAQLTMNTVEWSTQLLSDVVSQDEHNLKVYVNCQPPSATRFGTVMLFYGDKKEPTFAFARPSAQALATIWLVPLKVSNFGLSTLKTDFALEDLQLLPDMQIHRII